MRWKIFYDGGYTFSDEQGKPEDMPAFGVVCIVCADDLVGRMILHKFDWYYWTDGGWQGGDIYGLLDRLLHRLPTVAVCQGRTVPNAVYQEIMGRADKDPDFPPMSGKLP